MTDHPCKGMTQAQRETFELIAINVHPICSPKTRDALLASGLVVESNSGYLYVPPDIHYQWCKWCAEQPDTYIGDKS